MMLRTATTRCKPKSSSPVLKRFRTSKSKPSSSPSPSRRNALYPPPRTSNSPPAPFSQLPRPPNSAFLIPSLSSATNAPPEDLPESKCHAYFQTGVETWATNHRTTMRFARFGYEANDIRPILDAYVSVAQSGFFFSPENFAKYQLVRFTTCGGPSARGPEKAHFRLADAEITFSNIFFSWVGNIRDSAEILDELVEKGAVKQETLDSLRHLAIVSHRRPAEDFPWARRIDRKFIMHVGPTNSGKTHHALRALAAAKTGVYAGPLRLLAHEIWERLNLGQIVPLGVDVPPPDIQPPSSSSKVTIPNDSSIAPKAKALANPQYARQTNMITGEERKVIDEDAPLISCTVEMLSFRTQYDVGVIDEIQMIGDIQRGFAWTSAVLGLCAKEIHLCGEESAIPVIQHLLKETGDELEVRRYERLTPLNVEEKSLGGSFKNVKKGDCVVAFSRPRIFEIKEEIEKESGMKCAVVYGKLPPEIRSEQAALFNDPDSGYDVIIGSDAIGMGLNLKIRRIIFDQTSKPSGEAKKIPLSISQIKQIAGRAGRYGHTLTGEKPGGFTTTLHEKDLPSLISALSHPSTPSLNHAYISPSLESFTSIAPALLPTPASSTLPYTQHQNPTKIAMETVQMAHTYTSLPPSPVYKYTTIPKIAEICTWIDQRTKGVFTWDDKLQLLVCPIMWRDGAVVDAAEEMVRMQRDEMCVVLGRLECVVGDQRGGAKGKEGKRGLVWALEEVERRMELAGKMVAEAAAVKDASTIKAQTNDRSKPTSSPPTKPPTKITVDPELLDQLESLHKILVLYMWKHLRNSVVYPDREAVEAMKHRVEIALDWGLQEVGRGKVKQLGQGLLARAEVGAWLKGRDVMRDDKKVEGREREEKRDEEWAGKWKKGYLNKKETESTSRPYAKGKGKQSANSKHFERERRYGDDYYDTDATGVSDEFGYEKEYQQAWVSKLAAKPGLYYPTATTQWERKDRFILSNTASASASGKETEWTQAPDLTALLRGYVDSTTTSSLRSHGSVCK